MTGCLDIKVWYIQGSKRNKKASPYIGEGSQALCLGGRNIKGFADMSENLPRDLRKEVLAGTES